MMPSGRNGVCTRGFPRLLEAGPDLFITRDNMLESTFSYLISGTVFGLFAGIAPGPLLTLVVAETLRRSVRDGIKVALAPALTDLPIILVSVLILAKLTVYDAVIGAISLAGGTYLSYLGYECIKATGLDLDEKENQPSSLRKGVITNFLNPHPYLFWISVGAPTIIKGARVGNSGARAFSRRILRFYYRIKNRSGIDCRTVQPVFEEQSLYTHHENTRPVTAGVRVSVLQGRSRTPGIPESRWSLIFLGNGR